MRIELANLEDGKDVFANTYQPEEMVLSDDRVRIVKPVAVSGKVRRSGAEVFVTGHLETQAEIECDRCLKPLESVINTDFGVEYITDSEYEASYAAELSEEDLAVSVFDGEAIDLDEMVKEQLLLSLPLRSLCREDCKGICPVCGADRNSTNCSCESSEGDPRWAALRNLKLE